VLVIDGGIGTEIEARGAPMNDAAWSAVANLGQPDVVRQIHEDYIRAGAEVITANTFPCSRLVLEPAGLGERVAEINRRAVEIAREARDNAAERPVLIAGSLSPHGASGLPDPLPDPERVLSSFREQVEVQGEAGVDLFALEMIPNAHYGKPATQAAAETGLPLWLGMTDAFDQAGGAHEGGLAGLVKELVQPGVMSVNAMHIEIKDIHPALDQIEQAWDGVLGAYAHHGDWVPPNWVFRDLTPEQYLAEAHSWVARGVQIVGGCCGTRPAHIAALKEQLPARIPESAQRTRA